MPKKEVLRPSQCDTPGEVAKILTSVDAHIDAIEARLDLVLPDLNERLGKLEDAAATEKSERKSE